MSRKKSAKNIDRLSFSIIMSALFPNTLMVENQEIIEQQASEAETDNSGIQAVQLGTKDATRGPLAATLARHTDDVVTFKAPGSDKVLDAIAHRDFYSQVISPQLKSLKPCVVLNMKNEVNAGNIDQAMATLEPSLSLARAKNRNATFKLAGVDADTAAKLKLHTTIKTYNVEVISAAHTVEKLAATQNKISAATDAVIKPPAASPSDGNVPVPESISA